MKNITQRPAEGKKLVVRCLMNKEEIKNLILMGGMFMTMELLREEIFTNQAESEFFVKSEYDHSEHEFNFKALEKYTSEKFVKELKRDMPTFSDVVKKFKIVHYATFIRFLFLLTDGIREKEIAFVKAYHNKGKDNLEYYDIEVIDQNFLDSLELNVKVTNKRKKKVEAK